MKKLITLVLAASTAGCGVAPFVAPRANPIIEDQVGKDSNVYTLGTTADRRLVLVSDRNKEDGLFCAEASPDSLEALSSNFGLSGSGTSSVTGVSSKEGKAQLASALATSQGLATNRSQGLQFYRDAIFALCQSRMNGYIDNAEYQRQLWEVRRVAARLMAIEVQQAGFHKRPTIIVQAPAATNPAKSD